MSQRTPLTGQPTLKTRNETYAAFAQLGSGNLTIAAIEQFVEQNFVRHSCSAGTKS